MADPDLGRLAAAMQHSRLSLRRFRENRMKMIREYVGHWYSEEGTAHTVPVNLISLYEEIVGKSLIAQNPRVLLSTFQQQYKPIVSGMQSAVNREIKRMYLQQTLARAVFDSLFSMGIVYVGIATPGDEAVSGWQQDAGSPFAATIDLDDFAFDMHARRFSQAGFICHRLRIPKDAAVSMYRKKAKDLEVSTDNPYSQEGDMRLNVLQRSFYGDQSEFEEMVDLWQVYLPRHKMVVTLAEEHLTGAGSVEKLRDALHVQPYIGPECGSYFFLGHRTVPNNAMPAAPIQNLLDLHMAVNNIYRKSIRQAERQKEVLPVSGAASESGSRALQANDGEAFQSDHEFKPIVFGGPNANNAAMGNHLNTMFSRQAGNLDMAGGLAPQSKTLGQDEMLAQNASRAIGRMQEMTVNFTADVTRALCWYWHHHPSRTMQAPHQAPGMPGIGIMRKVTPQQRQQVPFEDMEIEVAPYSLQSQTPQGRLKNIMAIIDKMMPMMQMLQQQGIVMDANFLMKKIGEYSDAPDLQELFTIRQPPADPSGGGPPEASSAARPSQTSREYIRRSVGENTDANKEADFVNQMSAGASSNGKLEGAPS